jgi:radical SAM superfamily enzyme YgiQ (UPF0313 family)
MKKLRVVLVKPSKYALDDHVQRFHAGLMPNATLSHIASLTPDYIGGFEVSIEYIDEYIRTDLRFLNSLQHLEGVLTIVAVIGVQSHQFQRALDIAAFARLNGIKHVIIGGPHPMTCDTTFLHGNGVSFSLSEAEVVWLEILEDATRGLLKDTYGSGRRWSITIEDVEFRPPPQSETERHWVPMAGYYPVRGCPFVCSFCSVIKIAGRQIRNPSIDSIISALKNIKRAGIEFVVFTSDNFNKFPKAPELLTAMIEEKVGIRFWFQADTQIVKQEKLVELIGRAGGAEMFLGVESFDSADLKEIQKRHNKPSTYNEIVRMCRASGIRAHFSNIFGFQHQTEEAIWSHMDALMNAGPEFASFYILTPIPGTDQYEDFLEQGLIFEKNLDRFDAHTPTFHHRHISPDRLQELLYEAYSVFYKHSMKKYRARIDRETRNYMVFCRWSASNRMHPMSSGLGEVKIDKAIDYHRMRKQVFDVGPLLPLPKNLVLSKDDEAFNRTGKWTGNG